MTLIADLYALQEIDSQIDERQAALDLLLTRPTEDEQIAVARDDLDQAAAGLPELESRQRDLELQVAGLRDKAGPVERRLYDGSVGNPKELEDLQRDLEQLTRHRQTLEEELLSVLEQIEGKRAAVASASQRLQALEQAWSAGEASAEADVERLGLQLAELRGRRDAAASRVPSGPITSYDRLRRRRRGVAVVKVERGACLGCRLTVPPVVLQRARSGMNPTPVQCPSCERMLYVL